MTKIYKITTFQIDDNNGHLINHGTAVSTEDNKLVMVKNKKTETYEFPGGGRENGESIQEFMLREILEETGASPTSFEIICGYTLELRRNYSMDMETTNGALGVATFKLGTEYVTNFETRGVKKFDDLPTNLTFPTITSIHYQVVQAYLKGENVSQMGFDFENDPKNFGC